VAYEPPQWSGGGAPWGRRWPHRYPQWRVVEKPPQMDFGPPLGLGGWRAATLGAEGGRTATPSCRGWLGSHPQTPDLYYFFLKKKKIVFFNFIYLFFNCKITRDMGNMDIFRQMWHFSKVLVVW